MTDGLDGAANLFEALRAHAAQTGQTDLAAILATCGAETAARLCAVDQELLSAVLRWGAGAAPVPVAAAVVAHLAGVQPTPLFQPDIALGPSIALPTRGERPDMPAFSDRAFDAWFTQQSVPYGLGLYGEDRAVYATAQFADAASFERRTVHLGIDVFAPAGTPLHAPLAGQVRHLVYNADPLDYGHTLILEHEAGTARFFTLYGHLGGSLPGLLSVGDRVAAGQIIAHLGDWHENGGWAAHVHFQVMTTMLDQTGGNFFGVGHHSLWPVWQQICPDPNLILRLPADRFSL